MTAAEWWSYFTVGAVLGFGVLLTAWLICADVQAERQRRARQQARTRHRHGRRELPPPGRQPGRTVTVDELVERLEAEKLTPHRPESGDNGLTSGNLPTL